MIRVKTIIMHYFDTQTGERVFKEDEYFVCASCHSHINDDAIYCMGCGEKRTLVEGTLYRVDGIELTEEQYDKVKNKGNGEDAKEEFEKIKKEKEIKTEQFDENNV